MTTSIKQTIVLCDLNFILLSQYISYEINLYLEPPVVCDHVSMFL
jgi:hypothetical protein